MARTSKAGTTPQAPEEQSANFDAPATMEPRVAIYRITGKTPLMQNNPASFIGVEEEGGLTVGKKKYDDEEEARLRVYKEDDVYVHPTESFTKAMIKSAVNKRIGKNAATTVLKGTVFICEPSCVILNGDGKPATHYEIDRRPVVLRGKDRILRCRPKWFPWSMQVALELDTSIIQPKDVEIILSLAGRIVGIGDYRPEKGGGFGRFGCELQE